MNEQLSTEDNTPADAGENPTFNDAVNSLNGWEEIAIEEASDRPFTELMNHQTLLMRAVAAVLEWREVKKENPRAKYGAIFKDYMGRPQGSMEDVYAPAEKPGDGITEDDTPAGKDDESSEPEPMSSPDSASSPDYPPVSTPV